MIITRPRFRLVDTQVHYEDHVVGFIYTVDGRATFHFKEGHLVGWSAELLSALADFVAEADELIRNRIMADEVCAEFGHHYSIKTNTPRMWLCANCKDPGWEVPPLTEEENKDG